MLRITAWVLLGLLGWGFASCSITCPDGHVCSDANTCCLTASGYACCGYPKAVCCSDMVHCCPSGFRCNLAQQRCDKVDQPWMNVPMVKKVAAEEPSTPVLPVSPLQALASSLVPEQNEVEKRLTVQCDSVYFCPGTTTCCRHLAGGWYCCPFVHGRCCLDGMHCCPFGLDCDYTYQHCVRDSLTYPFSRRQAPASIPATYMETSEEKGSLQERPMIAIKEASADDTEIRCNAKFFCSAGHTCCKEANDQWSCCPYPLANCCSDGKHCCEYSYTCDPTSMTCKKGYAQVPSGRKESAKLV
ncbi:progranulin-like [Genypterus blacodes]|uniref:progranulin-like n=1 Tax=Genypterus blacodes TaxID=154954 RepID=UPI003F767F04